MTMNAQPCGICKGDPDRRAWVNSELVKQTPHTRIEVLSRELGMNVKRETIRRHVNVCIPAAIHESPITRTEKAAARARDWRAARAVDRAVERVEKKAPPPTPLPAPVTPIPLEGMVETDDFARLVRDEARRKLLAGELRINTQDGLSAQSLLDKREEKKKDRELMAQMGLLLARGSEAPPMIEEDNAVTINVTPDEEQVPV